MENRIHIIGRRWFQRSAGNTYHSAEIRINGETVFKSGRRYGYGQQYLQTAADWLKANGYPNAEGHSLNLRETVGATWTVTDVPRQRDL